MDVNEIRAQIRQAFDEISWVVAAQPFKSLLWELWSLPEELRHEFVETVILDSEELVRRDIRIPEGVSIQRSWFADNRPTLFCVTKCLPESAGWKKVTITFDNPISEHCSVGWIPESYSVASA